MRTGGPPGPQARSRPRSRILAAVVVAILATACGAGEEPAVPPQGLSSDAPADAPTDAAATEPGNGVALEPSEPFGTTTLTLTSPEGDEQALAVYDAYDPALRQRGLMGRESLPADAGMVFRFPVDATGEFWMKDTLIPLSIAFVASNGTIHTVLDMEPCEVADCPTYGPDEAYLTAIEVNQGAFADLGVGPGWTVGLPADLPPAT